MKPFNLAESTGMLNLITSCYQDAEMQAVFLAGLCCLGAWMVLSWFLQIIRSILWIWPLVVISSILMMVPTLRLFLAEEAIPNHLEALVKILGDRYFVQLNRTIIA